MQDVGQHRFAGFALAALDGRDLRQCDQQLVGLVDVALVLLGKLPGAVQQLGLHLFMDGVPEVVGQDEDDEERRHRAKQDKQQELCAQAGDQAGHG